MSYFQDFLQNLDLSALGSLVVQAIAALICIIFHECAHGFAADRLGDHTARNRGRLSWNPIRHIDPFGLLMMVVAGVGWAKPVPVNPNNFKHPKRGMALTALAGPAANFLLAIICLLIGNGLIILGQRIVAGTAAASVFLFFYRLILRMSVLNVGLALFNLIPIPPLDGAKVLFSFLPDQVYFKVMQYERYIFIAVFLLLFLGFLDGPLYALNNVVWDFLMWATSFVDKAVFALAGVSV